MKNGVHSMYEWRSSEGEELEADFHNNLIWASILLRKLFRWMGRVEELSFNIYLMSDMKVWRQSSSSIGRSLVVVLHKLDLL